MTSLPTGFKSTEHLQDTIRKQHNAAVRDYFKDLGDNWEPEVSTPRGSLRTACTMLEDDTAFDTYLRIRLLYDVLGYGRSGLAILHGSREPYAPPVEGHPKIVLYFSQDAASVPDDDTRSDAETTFRIMDETQATFTETKARLIAEKIKEEFTQSKTGIVFTKGKNIYSYKDEPKGYRLQIYGNNEADSVDIIKRSLKIQSVNYDDDKLTVHLPKKSNMSTALTHTVYGKQRKKKKYRPVVNVRFRYAYVEVPGYEKYVFLVDTTSRHAPLVRL